MAEGLVCRLKGLAFPIPRPRCLCYGCHRLRCVRDHSHHTAGQLDPQTTASSFNSFFSAVEKFWSLLGQVYLPQRSSVQYPASSHFCISYKSLRNKVKMYHLILSESRKEHEIILSYLLCITSLISTWSLLRKAC